jgi:hypothetical protein
MFNAWSDLVPDATPVGMESVLFNICSIGPTLTQHLTDTNKRYHLRASALPHHSLRTSQPMILLFSLIAPFDLQLIRLIQNLHQSRYQTNR